MSSKELHTNSQLKVIEYKGSHRSGEERHQFDVNVENG